MEVLDTLRSPSFDPGRVAVFQEDVPRLEPNGGGGGESEAQIIRYENKRIDLRASLSRPGFLITSEVNYPGWKAVVDGVEVKIYRANQAFRAIHLESGEHEVTFYYDPLSFKLGLWLTLFTLGFAILIGIWRVARQSRKTPPSVE